MSEWEPINSTERISPKHILVTEATERNMVDIGLFEIGIGIGGLVVGYFVGKMSGSGAVNHGDTVQRGGIKAGGNVNTGTEVGGNLAQDRAKQNN